MLTSFTRGAKSKLAGLCLAGSMLVGSGCALDLLPRVAQPGFYRDYKDEQNKEENNKSGEIPVEYRNTNRYKQTGKYTFYDSLLNELVTVIY